MNDKEKKVMEQKPYVDLPNDVWVEYPLPWVEGRCIPQERINKKDGRWVHEYCYPSPKEAKKNEKGIRKLVRRMLRKM